jgi:putative spermidine/putrescine transport system ATP-binding protein
VENNFANVSPASVRLTNVSRLYGETVAVKDLTLEVTPGEFLFLLGPSGAGKTTVLRMIGGYEQPSSGYIEIGGRDVTRLPVHKRDIGMVFQSYALFPHMTVAQNVAFGLKMRSVSRVETQKRVAEALELVELDGLERRFPRQLSGGQQQRVALARAIVYRPSLLLLDEPLANLDRRLRDTMRLELKQLQRRVGITTIMVTHDQEESLTMADRIAVMHRGGLEQVATPAEIYNNPHTPFVAAFIGEMNVARGDIVDINQTEVKVRLANGGVVSAPVSADLKIGDEVTYCIRAERLTLAPCANDLSQSQPGQNRLPATIEFVTYLGASTLYVVRPDNAPAFKVLETNAAGESLHSVGQRVDLTWQTAAAICFAGK